MPGPNFLDWFFLKIYNLFNGGIHVGSVGAGFKNTIIFILSLVAAIFLAVVIYSVMRLKERQKINHDKYHHDIHHAGPTHTQHQDNKKWDTVLEHIRSGNPGDWRIAIIEADNMLDKMTLDLGFVGGDLGERLKSASADHFKNLDNAWEAHKVRNKIAHEGLGFKLEYREAKKTIELYEAVFKEFGVI
jgi:hypothetical protein